MVHGGGGFAESFLLFLPGVCQALLFAPECGKHLVRLLEFFHSLLHGHPCVAERVVECGGVFEGTFGSEGLTELFAFCGEHFAQPVALFTVGAHTLLPACHLPAGHLCTELQQGILVLTEDELFVGLCPIVVEFGNAFRELLKVVVAPSAEGDDVVEILVEVFEPGIALCHEVAVRFHPFVDKLELSVDVPELALQFFHLLFSTVDLFVYAAQFQRMEVEGTDLLLQFLDIPVFGVDDHFNGGASRLAVDGR